MNHDCQMPQKRRPFERISQSAAWNQCYSQSFVGRNVSALPSTWNRPELYTVQSDIVVKPLGDVIDASICSTGSPR